VGISRKYIYTEHQSYLLCGKALIKTLLTRRATVAIIPHTWSPIKARFVVNIQQFMSIHIAKLSGF